MTRADIIRELQAVYAERQAKNRLDAEARIARACALDPEIAALRANSVVIATDALREMRAAVSDSEIRATADKMRRRGLAGNAEIRRRLAALNLPMDYLAERYACAKCRDTGYTDDMPAKFCECFELALRERIFEDGTMAGVREQNFDAFDDYIAPEGKQREDLLRARYVCEKYADDYPDTYRDNILLTGPGGVGKTFLANCIYARVVERGYSAARITAYRMFEMMRRQHIGNNPDESGFSELLDAPLLVIDDLGSEPMMKNITVEYLFTLLNERNAARKHTIIATNLTVQQLKERYGERVSSRITDASRCTGIRLAGKDLRGA